MILKDRDLCKNKKDYDFHSENHSPFCYKIWSSLCPYKVSDWMLV